MAAFVRFKMSGFAKSNHVTYQLADNRPFIFQNHEFLHSFQIDDSFEHITFYLKPGYNPTEYRNEISNELETICFNIIAHTDIATDQPICFLEDITDETGQSINKQLHDQMRVTDSIELIKTFQADAIYRIITSTNVDMSNHSSLYKELFYILHNPHKVIQFMGLYDIMADMIHSPIQQNKVHDFFGKNKKRYEFVEFLPSRKDPSKKEDCFTHLRNAIAHSKQVGIAEYVKIAENISEGSIKQLLTIINDLICGNVEK